MFYRFSTLVLWCALLLPLSSFGYTLSSSPQGQKIKWHAGQKFFLAGNPNNQSKLSPDQLWIAAVRGLQQWKQATSSVFNFEYWQGNNSQVFETEVSPDGLSVIFFASAGSVSMDPNVIGYTQNWYNSQTGELLEADIVLNDINFNLTNNPQDTSSQINSSSSRPSVYLNNIVTHELGHAIGLSHSSDINSSMLYVEFREQSTLGCDDWAAARDLYSSHSGGNSNTGSLSGIVVTPAGEPAAGVLVTAISRSRGIPLATVHTHSNGSFEFGALEPGNYGLQIRPFLGSPSSIPAQVQAKEQYICSDSSSFPAQFIFGDSQQTLQNYEVVSRKNANTSTIRIQCVATQNISPYSNSEFFADSLYPGQMQQYRFIANGPFKISVSSFLLSSPIQAVIKLYDNLGNIIPTKNESPTYQSNSLYTIPETQITGSFHGEIIAVLQTQYYPGSYFPIATSGKESNPYFVVSFRNPLARNPSYESLPNNARCAISNVEENYQSPPGNPVRSTFGTQRSVVGFCGSLQNIDKTMRSSGNRAIKQRKILDTEFFERSPLGSILGWFFPFWVALFYQIAQRIIRRASMRKVALKRNLKTRTMRV